MMDCSKCEQWMADALGDELSSEDRTMFDGHLETCERCRLEYESLAATVETMRDLPGPQRVSVRQEGNRLVIEDHSSMGRRSSSQDNGTRSAHRRSQSLLRYAAGLLMAFTGGYGSHAYFMLRDAMEKPPVMVQDATPRPNLEGSLAEVRARKPGRSKLATCLIAMSVRSP